MSMSITEKHDFLSANGLDLGEPTADEQTFDDGGGKRSFAAGTIYFNPNIGNAYECHGLILQAYIGQGEEASALGYPVTDEEDSLVIDGGRLNYFDGGRIVFDPSKGTTVEFCVPQIAVKIVDNIPINLQQGETLGLAQLEGSATSDELAIFAEIANLLPDIVFSRWFDEVSPEVLQKLIGEAQSTDPDYVPPLFENILELRCPAAFDPRPVVARLNRLPSVIEFAYRPGRTYPAGVVGTDNPHFLLQRYLDPAPSGIDAPSAWAIGADGGGLRLVDLEHAWLLPPSAPRHVDHPTDIALLSGINRDEGRGHGTATLGIIGAVDNNIGVVGIAPAASLTAISPENLNPTISNSAENVAAKMVKGAFNLRAGDVLLLEIQAGGGWPVELDWIAFHTIRLITKSGRIVVEAAGNGGNDLDAEGSLSDGGRLGDSGAILVGACSPTVPHQRWATTFFGSTFGQRIDCCAWGDDVHTTGKRRDPVPIDSYFEFSGTSAASAIIAGVCLLIQHAHTIKADVGTPALGPARMRDILRDPANCTPTVLTVDGVTIHGEVKGMPNLASTVANLPN